MIRRRWFAVALCIALLAAALMLLFYVNTPRSSEVIAAATATRAISTPTIFENTPPIAATDTPTIVDEITIHTIVFYTDAGTDATYTLRRDGSLYTGVVVLESITDGSVSIGDVGVPADLLFNVLDVLDKAATTNPQPPITPPDTYLTKIQTTITHRTNGSFTS